MEKTPPAVELCMPEPSQVGHTLGSVPALAPVPRQDGQGLSDGKRMLTVAPSTACSKEIVTSPSTSAPRRGPRVEARRVAPSLALMADLVRNPAFADSEVARVRDQQLAALSQTLANPRALANRELTRLLYGNHPYGQPADGLGDARSLAGDQAGEDRHDGGGQGGDGGDDAHRATGEGAV